jgi:aminomethyltransferase
VGQITSHTFSPILKKYIGIGNVLTPFAAPGSRVDVEVTVEYSRELAPATVVPTPFFDPKRKRE